MLQVSDPMLFTHDVDVRQTICPPGHSLMNLSAVGTMLPVVAAFGADDEIVGTLGDRAAAGTTVFHSRFAFPSLTPIEIASEAKALSNERYVGRWTCVGNRCRPLGYSISIDVARESPQLMVKFISSSRRQKAWRDVIRDRPDQRLIHDPSVLAQPRSE